MKRCPRCDTVKPLEEFWRDRRTKSGYAVYCIACGRVRNAEQYRATAARDGRETRPWRPLREDLPPGTQRCQRCGEVQDSANFVVATSKARGTGSYCLACNAANSVESRERKHGSVRNYHLKSRYGIDEQERARRIAAQGGVCLICQTGEPAHVDHDHATGAIRGMLCFNCNGGLGQFKDDVARLERAIRYLRGELASPTRDLPSGDESDAVS